jgi:hypothetical protein
MISFDATHAAVHYPKDRRFRIWVRPSILIGIGAVVLAAVLASWIEVAVAGLAGMEYLSALRDIPARIFLDFWTVHNRH